MAFLALVTLMVKMYSMIMLALCALYQPDLHLKYGYGALVLAHPLQMLAYYTGNFCYIHYRWLVSVSVTIALTCLLCSASDLKVFWHGTVSEDEETMAVLDFVTFLVHLVDAFVVYKFLANEHSHFLL